MTQGMVISLEIIVIEMGDRGSKLGIFEMITVKEQRVDGSLRLIHKRIRCTLMGFERNYQARIPSNLTNTLRNNCSIMSTLSESELTINP